MLHLLNRIPFFLSDLDEYVRPNTNFLSKLPTSKYYKVA